MRLRRRTQRGDVDPRLAVGLSLLVIALMAWWMYAPESFPIFGQRPEPDTRSRAGTGAAPRAVGTAPAANPALYKWRDDNGQWHVTDKPPQGRAFEKVVVDPDTNVIPSDAGSSAPARTPAGEPVPR